MKAELGGENGDKNPRVKGVEKHLKERIEGDQPSRVA
jgi:hypothetical protein